MWQNSLFRGAERPVSKRELSVWPHVRGLSQSSAALKEALNQLSAFISKDPADYRGLRMQHAGGVLLKASFVVFSAEYHPFHLRPTNGSSAHCAWLNSHIKRTFIEIFAP